MECIVNQILLAERANVTPEHLSHVKHKRSYSPKLLAMISKLTGIPTVTLLSGSRKKVDKAFADFFRSQREMQAAIESRVD